MTGGHQRTPCAGVCRRWRLTGTKEAAVAIRVCRRPGATPRARLRLSAIRPPAPLRAPAVAPAGAGRLAAAAQVALAPGPPGGGLPEPAPGHGPVREWGSLSVCLSVCSSAVLRLRSSSEPLDSCHSSRRPVVGAGNRASLSIQSACVPPPGVCARAMAAWRRPHLSVCQSGPAASSAPVRASVFSRGVCIPPPASLLSPPAVAAPVGLRGRPSPVEHIGRSCMPPSGAAARLPC
jgi:hypothetical protein